MSRNKTTWPVWLRRTSQSIFLVLFFYLFLENVYHPVNQAGRGVDLFFQIDPLVLVSSWLASHQAVASLLLSLITVGVTLVAGRWFCGWICPFGTFHNLFTALRSARAKDKVDTGAYSRFQQTKYYILIGLIVACVLGLNLTGWLDPFSFLYRSLATVVYPMLNDVIVWLFGSIYQADPSVGPLKVTAVSEPVYEVLRRHFLATAQPHFYGTIFIALLLGTVLFLNLYRSRFWCRYICPLGGLLGAAGKNPLVQIKQDSATCNNCRACVADCQGGANPDIVGGWKPSECLYCWNCHSACPNHSIKFTVRVPGEKHS
jgi:polyferredoxin